MPPTAVVVWAVIDTLNRPIPNALIRATSAYGPWQGLTNCAGEFYSELTPGSYIVTMTAPGFTTRVQTAEIMNCGRIVSALDRSSAPLPFANFRGAFCIPDALQGLPYGDGRRVWTPAFGCYRDAHDRSVILNECLERHATWFQYQLSGKPYHDDYPELDLDVARIVEDLAFIRASGLRTLVSFDDRRGTDCSYLRDVAIQTQGLVDGVMGIYESNGVFADASGNFTAQTYADVESVLRQQHDLWPLAINGFHSTAQNNGAKGFGEADFWRRVSPFVDVYLYQTEGWSQPFPDVADRMADFTERLMGGMAGWPVLRHGVVLYEAATTQTYHHAWTEAQGAALIDRLMTELPRPSAVRPSGYMDGGTIAVP